jgi:hypothetical protein
MRHALLTLTLLTTMRAEAHTPDWMDHPRLRWELAVGAVAGADFGGGPALAGVTLRAGPLLSISIGDDTDTEYALLQTAFGNAWGADLRLTTLGATRGPTTFAAGLALVSTHALQRNDWRRRLRVPSVLGLVMPEVGLAARPGRDAAVYSSWSLPFAVLLDDSLGLEVTPHAFVIYGPRTETIGLVSLTLVRRPTARDEREDPEPERPHPPPQRTPDYVVHPSAPGRVVLDIASPARHDIAFVRERSPVAATLRAVEFDDRHAYAVGDGGVILERQPRTAWRLEPSGTTRNLRAIGQALTGFVAVGDGGTIVYKNNDDDERRWRTQPSPTQQDLFAVGDNFIAGAHGALLTWADGRWRSVDTGVDEDLRALWDCSYNEHLAGGRAAYHRAVCAAGQRGRLVRCIVERLSVDCTAQPSPTTSDLYAAIRWPFVFGADGTVLVAEASDPFSFAPAPTLQMGDVHAVAENHWMPTVDGSGGMAEDALAVGAGGAVVHWTRGRDFEPPVILDASVDLFGTATRALDWFVVGSDGAIFHGVTEHVAIWPVMLL